MGSDPIDDFAKLRVLQPANPWRANPPIDRRVLKHEGTRAWECHVSGGTCAGAEGPHNVYGLTFVNCA
jgi:hypothetical protein